MMPWSLPPLRLMLVALGGGGCGEHFAYGTFRRPAAGGVMRCMQLAGWSLTVVAVVVAAAGCSSSTHASSAPVSSAGSTAAAATPSSPAATSAGSTEKSTAPSEPGGGYQLASAV